MDAGKTIEVEFEGKLRAFRQEAADEIAAYDEGILSAPTAFGKTAVAWLIAQRRVNTLVVVHRQQLLDQWQERLGVFLRVSGTKAVSTWGLRVCPISD